MLEAKDHKLENALKRGREKVKEVAEKERTDRARVKEKRNNIIMECIVFRHDLPQHQNFRTAEYGAECVKTVGSFLFFMSSFFIYLFIFVFFLFIGCFPFLK